jgi:putative RNA 2'-phosphotransferase
MNEKEIKNKSKLLSLVLRHSPETIGITLDENGWTNVKELITQCNIHNCPLDETILEYIVENNDKKRFTFNDDKLKIRANQGHSIDVELNLAEMKPIGFLYHGTVDKFIESIKKSGLKKMKRQHVHLSKDKETAEKVALRRGIPIILTIHAKQMHEDGVKFYVSENGVWLTDFVDPKYLFQLEQ